MSRWAWTWYSKCSAVSGTSPAARAAAIWSVSGAHGSAPDDGVGPLGAPAGTPEVAVDAAVCDEEHPARSSPATARQASDAFENMAGNLDSAGSVSVPPLRKDATR